MVSYLSTGVGSEEVVRCVEGLKANPNIWRLGNCPNIRLLAKRIEVVEGEVVVEILRAFAPKGRTDPERALSDVDVWIMSQGKRYRCRRHVLLAYVSDAHVALANWISSWNKRADKWAAKLEVLDS